MPFTSSMHLIARLCVCVALFGTGSPSSSHAEETEMLLENHPLSETIWNTGTGMQSDLEALRRDVEKADFLLVGERHDNPLHHEKQAFIVSIVREAGKSGQLVFEMAEQIHKDELAQANAANVPDLGKAIDWNERGWPDWSYYQPIAEEALAANMRLKAGNPDRAVLMTVGRGGTASDQVLDGLRWDVDYDDAQRDDLLDELVAAHCNMVERDAMGPMATMQRLKDAHMARAMRQDRAAGETSVLIAGNGHTRKDRGVPMFFDEESSVLSVALIEVVRGEEDQTSYASFDPTLYDYVWFTPRVDEVDPCEKFRKQLEGMKSRMGKQHKE